jgi:hypothetical protein
MSRIQLIFPLSLICITIFAGCQIGFAIESAEFTQEGSDPYSWYDDWGIYRTYYAGTHGFIPNLADETLDQYEGTAYEIGLSFREKYSSKTERAAAILKYVQRWTEYGFDEDNVIMKGYPQPEWAWNADEMAGSISEVNRIAAIGDCEDMAFLCGTIYLGAGIEAAIVDAPEHCALVIWLPEYPNADKYWDVPNDGREAGWIWVEATGDTNPLGWTPPEFKYGGWTAYPIGDLEFVPEPQPESYDLISIDWLDIDIDLLLPAIFIVLLVILALAKSKRGH